MVIPPGGHICPQLASGFEVDAGAFSDHVISFIPVGTLPNSSVYPPATPQQYALLVGQQAEFSPGEEPSKGSSAISARGKSGCVSSLSRWLAMT